MLRAISEWEALAGRSSRVTSTALSSHAGRARWSNQRTSSADHFAHVNP